MGCHFVCNSEIKLSSDSLINIKKIRDKRHNNWNRETRREDNDKLNRVMFDLFCHIFIFYREDEEENDESA